MMPAAKPLRVLIVEDSEDDALLVVRELERGGYRPDWRRVETPSSLAEALSAGGWEVVLADFTMPRFSGGAALEMIRASGLDLPFLFVSGTIGEDVAVDAMRSGAHDYIIKGNLKRLVPAIERELGEAVVRRARRRAEEELRKAHEELERRVEERTLQLSEANRKLLGEIAERERAERDRDRMSAQLLQGQKIQAIGQLAAGIAHEINNPCGYILSNMNTLREYLEELADLLSRAREILSREPADPAAAQARADLAKAWERVDVEYLLKDFRMALQDSLKGAERIRDIVKGLKEFSHPDEGDLQPLHLHVALDDAIRIISNELRFKAEVKRDYGEVPPVRGSAARLEQVLVNILLNAAQAIESRGEIAVSTRLEEGRAVVRIRDTGCGIPRENVGKLFEPFFTTKPVGRGTGLGLHVAYKIVKAHGGTIEVRSEVGKGTEFTIRLPLDGPRPAQG